MRSSNYLTHRLCQDSQILLYQQDNQKVAEPRRALVVRNISIRLAESLIMSAGAKRWPQYVATFAATMGSFGLGTGIAWSSPAIPLIKSDCQVLLNASDNCAFKVEDDVSGIDDDQAKWVSSIFNLGAMVAAVLTGILLGKVGRKWAMIISCVPMAVGYLCLMLPIWADGTNPSFFFVGRFLTGKSLLMKYSSNF